MIKGQAEGGRKEGRKAGRREGNSVFTLMRVGNLGSWLRQGLGYDLGGCLFGGGGSGMYT